MNRKPIFDTIRWERNRPFTAPEIPLVDELLTQLGFPITSTSPMPPPVIPPQRGLLRRSYVFAALRDQLSSITQTQITQIDNLLTKLDFPPVPLVTGTPAPSKPSTPIKTATLVATVGAGCAALITASLDRWEPAKNPLVPYRDIVGKATNCRGNTVDVDLKKVYTAEQCRLIDEAAAVAHSTPVQQAVPQIADGEAHPAQLAAAISLAYNIGTPTFSHTTIANNFRAYRWRSACDGFPAFSRATFAKLPPLPSKSYSDCRPKPGAKSFTCRVNGLYARRLYERNLCLTNLPKEYDK